MTDRPLDALFVNVNGSRRVYQDLAADHSAIEPPVWCLLLAESCRAAGFGVGILDANAERLSEYETAARIADARPRLAVFVLYGSEPNQSTVLMGPALAVAAKVKELGLTRTCFVGNHVSALPLETLAEPAVDFVLLNEGVYALRQLLTAGLGGVARVPGVGWKVETCDGWGKHLNPPAPVVPQDRMDADLPGMAWDLLPGKNLDLYRSHAWHAGHDQSKRSPFFSLYTSLGCFAKCSFCMINSINRHTNDAGWSAADSAGMRYWSTEWCLRQFDKLANMGVKTGKLADEMFFFRRPHYEPLLEGLVDRGYGKDLSVWAYARVDTVRPKYLDLFRHAGITSLVLGIESGNQTVRREVAKGSYAETDVRQVVREVEDAGINVQGNYIFGLPDDTLATMQETLDLSCELNTLAWNAYPAMALPGSPLHLEAKRSGWTLPASWDGYGFYSYDCQPLPTRHLDAATVLAFRDQAFHTYHGRPEYLAKLEARFGPAARAGVEAILGVRLKRKLLGY